MVTHCGWAASQWSPGTACILVFRSPILGLNPSTFLLNEGAWAALWEASCPEPQPTSQPHHLLGLNGEPLLARASTLTHPANPKEAPRSTQKAGEMHE